MDMDRRKEAVGIGRKIKALRREAGLTQIGLAEKLNIPQSTISKYERGANIPGSDIMGRLALALNVTPKDIIGVGIDGGAPGRRVSVIGALAAGEWAETIEWPYYEQFEVPLLAPDSLAGVPITAFRVEGDSMNKIYPNNSIVYVSPLRGNPRSGDVVVVMRSDAHGLTEGTLKEYVVDGDGKKWLWPRSSAPEHQAPLQYMSKRGDTVEVTGVVVAALTFPGARH